MPTWSTREALERAAILQAGRSADVRATLEELERGFGWDGFNGLCDEHEVPMKRLAELHELIDHLVANLKGGHGIPATPAASVPRKAMPPVTYLKVQQPHQADMRPTTNEPLRIQRLKASYVQRAEARAAQGLANASEAAALCGFSRSGWSAFAASGRAPKPCQGQGRTAVWRRADLVDIKPRRNAA
jgi:hypothetical protein